MADDTYTDVTLTLRRDEDAGVYNVHMNLGAFEVKFGSIGIGKVGKWEQIAKDRAAASPSSQTTTEPGAAPVM